MSSKRKIVRTLQFKNRQKIGVLAKLISAISAQEADIGNIATVSVGELFTVRNITVLLNDEVHLQRVVDTVKKLGEDISLEAVIDEVLEIHKGGKLVISPKVPVHSVDDLQKVYTPGVASVCQLIKDDPSQAATYTTISKTVGLITNGSRVLGLGNLGPVASMPVMEGKAALFSQFSGMHMIPVLINTLDVDLFVKTVETISSTFAAIQLEDIRTPDCFDIEGQLIQKLLIPVMHDDQHGTATVTLAALINACQMAGLDLRKASVGQIGLGAAGSAIANLIMQYSGNPVFGSDLNEDCNNRLKSLGGIPVSSIEELMKKSQVVVATTGMAGLIKPEWVQKGQVILPLSNPYPEISIKDALAAGAAFASDGTRVNNLLAYPGILRGAVHAKTRFITTDMYIAAALAIVGQTPEGELVPDALDPMIHQVVAKAVEKAAHHKK